MMIQMVLGYVFIAGFLLFEAVLRRGESAKSLDRGGSDRGSTAAVGVSYGTAVLLPLVLNLVHVGRMQTPVLSWLGLAAMVSGLALRAWSMRALGTFYSRTLRIVGSQEIIDRGPYRLIRHPGYLGSILLWVGSGLAFSNWTSLIVVAVLMLGVYISRINAEEEMLVAAFGERYIQYRKRTWRLLPLLY